MTFDRARNTACTRHVGNLLDKSGRHQHSISGDLHAIVMETDLVGHHETSVSKSEAKRWMLRGQLAARARLNIAVSRQW
ncbi:hypothetical protein [Sphingomonas sp. OK281]|uniref:hypothetical protein n=1 Tax=Sphingomonas sp. OK281 TaxID=1881067 RepID=UPI001114394B|nr:hypothetical protein [Sphingomonas sp. OK281]